MPGFKRKMLSYDSLTELILSQIIDDVTHQNFAAKTHLSDRGAQLSLHCDQPSSLELVLSKSENKPIRSAITVSTRNLKREYFLSNAFKDLESLTNSCSRKSLSIKYLPSNVFLTLEKRDHDCVTIFLLNRDLCKHVENSKKAHCKTITKTIFMKFNFSRN